MSTQSISPEERLSHLEGHYADRVTAFRQRLALVGLDRVLIFLLDIGKNVHWATAWTAAGRELVRPFRLPTTRAGLTQFIHMLDALIAEHLPLLVLLGHEPSGVYHEPWARALMEYYAAHLNGLASPAFDYRFFNPYQVKLARQQTHLRHRKSDPLDLAAMYDLILRGLGQPAFLPSGTELLIRQEIGFIRAQSRLLRHLERQLYPQLDRLWPGAVVNLNQFTQAGVGGAVAGGGEVDEGRQACVSLCDEGFGGGVLEEEALELVGEWGSDVRGEQDGVVGPGVQVA